MSHTCRAIGCTVEIPERLFMHREHWFMVPKSLRDTLWQTYRPGQEVTKDPSTAYVLAATAAIAAVALQEQCGTSSEEWLEFLGVLPDHALKELQPQIASIIAKARHEHAQAHRKEDD